MTVYGSVDLELTIGIVRLRVRNQEAALKVASTVATEAIEVDQVQAAVWRPDQGQVVRWTRADLTK